MSKPASHSSRRAQLRVFGCILICVSIGWTFSVLVLDSTRESTAIARVHDYEVHYARDHRQREAAEPLQEREPPNDVMELEVGLDAEEVPFGTPKSIIEKFRVVVMTMDRAESLSRLLDSINDAHFHKDEVILDIWIDRPKQGKIDENVLAVARNFDFKHGRKVIYKRTQNAGLFRQWVLTWHPSDAGENAILLEDDLEVSPYFYTWLKRARQAYMSHPEIASFTLQRAGILCSKYENSFKIHVPDRYSVFLYNLLGSWGHSPNREHWRKFAEWFKERAWDKSFKPYVDGLVMTDWYKKQEGKETMWTMFYIYWCEKYGYYNMYVNLHENKTLASNWQEPGLHFRAKVRL